MKPAHVLSIGTIPSRCARKSSKSAVVFWWNSTLSMAMVGTSACIARRRALATLMSVLDSVNLIVSSVNSSITTVGERTLPAQPRA